MIKKLLLLLLIAVIAVVAGAVYVKSELQAYLEQPITIEQADYLQVNHGTGLARLLTQLEQQAWIQPSSYSRLIRRLEPQLTQVKSGTYQVQPQVTLRQLLQQLITGNEHQFTITFIEGSRFSEWQQQLANAEMLQHKTVEMSEADIAKELGIEQEKLEGLFLAETYHYTAGMSDLQVLRRAHQALMKELDAAWQTKAADLPLKTSYQALTLASIIEKETSLDEERQRVASVFVNRLKRGMRLQTDPTVIYGMGDKYDGNIRKRDLKTLTAYNTYVINGLPPTPIAMVGVASIRAALNPEKSSYLYFVASGNGGHVFTKSLVEHNRAVQRYLRVLRNNK